MVRFPNLNKSGFKPKFESLYTSLNLIGKFYCI